MALFDRRLLAYFDDGGGISNATYHDRIADYQHDLTEIERELCKYQHLLGPHRVKVKARDRHGWLAHHRRSAFSAREHGDRLAAAAASAVTQPGNLSYEEHTSFGPSAGLRDHLHVQPSHEEQHKRRPEPVQEFEPSPGMSVTSSTEADRQIASSSAKRHSTADVSSGRKSIAGRRPSRSKNPSPTTKEDSPAIASQDMEGRQAISTTWAQVDTLFLSSQHAAPHRSTYNVRGQWLGHSQYNQALPKPAEPFAENAEFVERCKIRHQIKLDGASDVRYVLLTVFRVIDTDKEVVLGTCKLDTLDERVHTSVDHSLYDDRGQQLDSKLRVRINIPALSAPNAVTRAGRSVDSAQEKRQSLQAQEASITGEYPSQRRPSVTQDPTAVARGSIVRQPEADAAPVPVASQSTRKSSVSDSMEARTSVAARSSSAHEAPTAAAAAAVAVAAASAGKAPPAHEGQRPQQEEEGDEEEEEEEEETEEEYLEEEEEEEELDDDRE